MFGSAFLEQLRVSPMNRWAGLVDSKHGKHLVRVSQITLKPSSAYESVRDAVYKDWVHKKREQWMDAQLERLRVERGIDLQEFIRHDAP